VAERKLAAYSLLLDNPSFTKSILSRALAFSRDSWYYSSKLESKDKQLSTRINKVHIDDDDTLGHKKLAKILGVNKKRVLRVMKKYGIKARRRSNKYRYHGKATIAQPNVANQEEVRESLDQGIIFSDIFEFKLMDGSVVRGCFALLKQTRQILSMIFDYGIKATLVQATITNIHWQDDLYIWHSDQGRQYGAEDTISLVIEKGLLPSMSRAGTPTDNPYAERFVSSFKHAVVRRHRYPDLGSFLHIAQRWINFYNQVRPHQSLNQLSPNQYAVKYGWQAVPNITQLTVQ
jgi:transposase InsO family protein